MSQPLCTIAIPVYNQLRFFEKALSSITSQQHLGLEILVVDDGSKDEIWNKLQQMVPPQVTLHRNVKNLGLFQNWNRCLELARGKYFGILCSDDEHTPEFLSASLKALEESPNDVLISTCGITQSEFGTTLSTIGDFFEVGSYLGPKAISILLEFYGYTGHNPFNYPSGVLFRTAAARSIGGFDVSMRHVGDVDFFLRLMTVGGLQFSNSVGCRVTLHSEQAGSVRAAQPYGMEEFQRIISSLENEIADSHTKSLLKTQFRALALWHCLKFAAKGQTNSFKNYAKFIQEGHEKSLALVRGLFKIFAAKQHVKANIRSHRWQLELNQART